MNNIFLELVTVYEQLTGFAGIEDFWNQFNTAFGSEYDQAKAENLRIQWLNRNFSQLPNIRVLDSGLDGTVGAYAQSTNTIYLSQSFLETSTQEQIQAVLLEEIGHFVDALINGQDSPGDEGAIFAALVSNITLTPAVLSVIQSENDKKYIFIDGNLIEIEQSAPVNVIVPEVLFLRTINSATVIEGETLSNVAVVFSNAPSGKVRILLESSDFTINANPLEIDPPGLTNGFILSEIFSIDDNITQGQRDVTVTIRVYTDTILSGTSSSFTVTILDNDFVVTNTNDSGPGSLRQAILNANTIAGANTITFAGVFTDATPDIITLTSGELTITDSLTIQGTGANLLTISGNNNSRIFNFDGAGANTFNLSGLTITGGNADFGGGIRGQISEEGDTLNIDEVVVTGNTATNSGGGISIVGLPPVTSFFNISNSTISNNDGGLVGGIFLNNVQNTELKNVTISGNTGTVVGGIANLASVSI